MVIGLGGPRLTVLAMKFPSPASIGASAAGEKSRPTILITSHLRISTSTHPLKARLDGASMSGRTLTARLKRWSDWLEGRGKLLLAARNRAVRNKKGQVS